MLTEGAKGWNRNRQPANHKEETQNNDWLIWRKAVRKEDIQAVSQRQTCKIDQRRRDHPSRRVRRPTLNRRLVRFFVRQRLPQHLPFHPSKDGGHGGFACEHRGPPQPHLGLLPPEDQPVVVRSSLQRNPRVLEPVSLKKGPDGIFTQSHFRWWTKGGVHFAPIHDHRNSFRH